MRANEIGGGQLRQMDYFKFINFDQYAVTFAVNKEFLDIFSPYLKKYSWPINLVLLPMCNQSNKFFNRLLKWYEFYNTIKPDCIIFTLCVLKSVYLPELIAAFLFTKGNTYMIVRNVPDVFPKSKSKLHFGFFPGLGLGWRKQRLYQTLFGYFTKNTLAVSNDVRNSLVNYHKFPNRNVKVVYHGVDISKNIPSRENRTKLREGLNIVDSDIVIISTARLFPIKRIDRLVEAFSILARERSDIQLLIAGCGPERDKLISMVDSFCEGIKRRIKFLGFREDVPAILQLSDIYVLPSESEGLPHACLEAMSCGLISIGTHCDGTSEIIQDGYNGFLVEKSCEGVLDGLRRAINLSPEEKDKISRNARHFIEEKCNLEKNIQRELRVLKMSDL